MKKLGLVWIGLMFVMGFTTYAQNVGIGDANPPYKLSVNGTLGSSSNAFISGNVGIGTAAPTFPLHVEKTGIYEAAKFKMNNGTAGPHIVLAAQNGGTEEAAVIDYMRTDAAGGDAHRAGALELRPNQRLNIYKSANTTTTADLAMTVLNSGNVGIGTATPTQAKLVVNGSVSNTVGARGFLNTSGAGNTGAAGLNHAISIYASNMIQGSDILATSDARIKNVIGISNKNQDLETINKIQITDYKMIDVVNKGNKNYKKVIAQQVETVYPQAVHKTSDFIPNVYELSQNVSFEASTKNLTVKTAKNHDFKVGDKVRLMVEEGQKEVTVSQILDNQTFVVANWEKATDKVFVFGKEVNDFRSVDYEALSMLNVSATQKLYELIQTLQSQVEGLKAENGALKGENKDLKASVESRLQALEMLIQDVKTKK